METYGQLLRRLRTAAGLSMRKLEAHPAVHVSYSHIAHMEAGREIGAREVARELDDVLNADGALLAAYDRARGGHRRRRSTLTAPRTRVVQALETAADDGLDVVADTLEELIPHFAQVVSRSSAYDDLLSVRQYTGGLVPRATEPLRRDLTVSTGWLSGLLAVATGHAGDSASALVWLRDAERRAKQAEYPPLAAFATLTRSTLAYYGGDPARAAELAAKGRRLAPTGGVAHARLAAQEMRSRAAVGDAAGTATARRAARHAMSRLDSHTDGVLSIPVAEDPPYTAVSALLVGDHDQAATVTTRLLADAYPDHAPARQTSAYARTLMVLALADAGRGRIADAATIGAAALDAAPTVWPTLVLARRLSTALGRYAAVAEVADYHERLAAAGLPGGPLPITA